MFESAVESLTRAGVALPELGVLAVRGADALRFLQGQLSNDTAQLATGVGQLAGYHSPQGRTVALLRLLAPEPARVLAILPAELVSTVRERLAKFVLRAKVSLHDETAAWQVHGVLGPPPPLPSASLRLALDDPRGRALVLTPAGTDADLGLVAGLDPLAWRRLDIEAGLPQVFKSTSELFVAQMLNLDLLGGIAFTKGCYTGQEVIARAHYRGRVKRRLQRFRSLAPPTAAAALAPGAKGCLADGRAFTVIDAARADDGRVEFLAVTALPAAAGSAPDAEEPRDCGPAAPTLEAESLPLPYALPAP
jgi:folate-binding protein YgfZ